MRFSWNILIFLDPKSLKSFGNSLGNSYIPSLLLIVTLHFTYIERKIGKISKSQNIMITIVSKNFLFLLLLLLATSNVNPLNFNFPKWSNTLKQFVGKLPTIFLSVFDHFVGLTLKGLKTIIFWLKSYLRKWPSSNLKFFGTKHQIWNSVKNAK